MTWVQVPYTRIEERHAWDCHRRISGAALYKPMRHFEHHKNAGKRYWVLVLRPKHLIPGEGRKCLERRNTNKNLARVPG
jgi:hypothetical protein